MKSLAEIFYDAIKADAYLTEATGGRVTSTCFEVPPDEKDNTDLPYIIVTNDGFHHNQSTKDCVWEGPEDVVQASVEIAAASDGEVEALVRKVRKAIEDHVVSIYSTYGIDAIPQLQPGYPQAGDLSWDWMKPCYYQTIIYQCITKADIDDEQEDTAND